MSLIFFYMILPLIINLTSNHIWDSYKENKDLKKGLKSTYLNALKKYSRNWHIRLTTSRYFKSHFEELVKYIKEPIKNKAESNYDRLIVLWHNELKNNEITYSFILEQIGNETLDKINTIAARYKVPFKSFNPIPDYIPRLVSVEKNEESDFFSSKSTYPLFDITTEKNRTDENAKTINKFILYSGAQEGKTTELNYLAYRMHSTGHYLPFLLDLNNYIPVTFIQRMKSIAIEHDNTVFLLDAYDEIKDTDKGYFIKELNLLIDDFPKITIVISSRANFEDKNNFKNFKPLYLEPLSLEDVHGYIRQNNEGIFEPFIARASDLNVNELLKTPFYLKSMLKHFSKNNDLPKTKSELYKILIQESFDVDEKHKQEAGHIQKLQTKGYKLLQKIAFVMTVCEKKELSEDEFSELASEGDFQTAHHFGIFKRDDTALKYSFEHLAFKEFLVADLLTSYQDDIVSELIFYPDSNKLINSWYNIVLLFLEIVHDTPAKFQSLIEVLIENESRVIVEASPKFLSKANRINIFKKIFNDYKDKGLYIPYYEFRENLMRFANYPETILFLTQELNVSANTVYYNALVLMEYVDYGILPNETKEEVKYSLKAFLANHQDFRELRHYVMFPFDNDEYYNEKDIKEIGEIIKENEQAEVLDHYFDLLLKLKDIDKYAESIFQMQQYIRDYHDNGTTHIVKRYSVYQVYDKFKSLTNITKALVCLASEKGYLSRNKEEPFSVKEKLLQKLSSLYLNDENPNIIQSVLDAFIKEEFSIYSPDKSELDTAALYKEFFKRIGQTKKVLDNEYVVLEESLKNNSQDHRRELLIPLLITEEYFMEKMRSYNTMDSIGLNRMQFSLPIDAHLKEKLSRELNEYFNVPKPVLRDFEKENQEDFNLVVNYQQFKNEIERHCNSDCRLIHQYRNWNTRKLEYVSECVVDFFYNFTRKDVINIEAARQAIDNPEIYKRFTLRHISQYLDYNNENYSISANEHQKEVISDLISHFIDNDLIEDNLNELLVAISFVDFTLTEEQIVKFMPFSYKKIPDHIGHRYNLMGDNDGDVFSTYQTTLMELLINKSSRMFVTKQMKVIIESDTVYDDSLYVHISRYLTRNKMNAMYSYLPIILYDKVKEECERGTLLYYISSIEDSFSLIGSRFGELPDRLKITYFRTLENEDMPESTCSILWEIYGRVEGSIKTDCLSELLVNGRPNALDEFIIYINEVGEYINADKFPRLPYTGEEYLDSLLEILDLVLEKVDISYNRISDVVLHPIRETAVLSRESLEKVNVAFERMIKKYDKYHFLNRELITMTEQLYESSRYNWSINEALSKYENLSIA